MTDPRNADGSKVKEPEPMAHVPGPCPCGSKHPYADPRGRKVRKSGKVPPGTKPRTRAWTLAGLLLLATLFVPAFLPGCVSTLEDALGSKEVGVSIVVPLAQADVLARVVAALEGEGSGPVVVEGGIVKAEIAVGGLEIPAKVVVWAEPVEGGVRVTVRAVNVNLALRGIEERLLARVRGQP